MDTTSNALARILHLLSEHQDVQDKLRAELLDASEAGDIPYDQLIALPYLEAVCRETLRLCVNSLHSDGTGLTYIGDAKVSASVVLDARVS